VIRQTYLVSEAFDDLALFANDASNFLKKKRKKMYYYNPDSILKFMQNSSSVHAVPLESWEIDVCIRHK
jgi:hypothetical protein